MEVADNNEVANPPQESSGDYDEEEEEEDEEENEEEWREAMTDPKAQEKAKMEQ